MGNTLYQPCHAMDAVEAVSQAQNDTKGAGDGKGLLARLLDDCCWHLGPTASKFG